MMPPAAPSPDGQSPRPPLPSATVKRSHLTWLLWLIPAGAAALCLWFLYRDYIAAGPLITISFKNAGGLQEENTQVQYRGTQIGEVKKIFLSPDAQSVMVKARLASFASELARAGSVFWIVRPEVSVGAISGLQTIVSGNYIEVQPGGGPATNTFTGAEQEPIEVQSNALQVILLAHDLGSIQTKSPVFYRGLQVGQVDYFQLAGNSQQILFHAEVWPQYAPLVRFNSVFWNAGGFDVHLGLLKGIQITAESPRTVISGGIEFATPTDYGDIASNGAIFQLFEKPEDKWKAWSPAITLHLPPAANPTNAAPRRPPVVPVP